MISLLPSNNQNLCATETTTHGALYAWGYQYSYHLIGNERSWNCFRLRDRVSFIVSSSYPTIFEFVCLSLAVLNAGVCEVTWSDLPLEVIRRLASAGWEIQNSIQEKIIITEFIAIQTQCLYTVIIITIRHYLFNQVSPNLNHLESIVTSYHYKKKF